MDCQSKLKNKDMFYMLQMSDPIQEQRILLHIVYNT